jgi:hypothetical protein
MPVLAWLMTVERAFAFTPATIILVRRLAESGHVRHSNTRASLPSELRRMGCFLPTD